VYTAGVDLCGGIRVDTPHLAHYSVTLPTELMPSVQVLEGWPLVMALIDSLQPIISFYKLKTDGRAD